MLHRDKHNKKGFTLVEVIVVLVILAILAGLAGLGLTSYIRMARFEHNESSARTAFQAAQIALTRKDTSGELADFQGQLRDTGVLGKHFTAEALKEQYGEQDAAAKADEFNSRIYALYYDKANPTSAASQLVRDLIGPYVYDDSLFNASICLEIDALSGQVYSAFYDTNSDKLRFALDDGSSGAMLIDDRSFAHRRGESLVGYYSADDTINVVQLTQTRLKVKNPLLINNETLTLNWSGNSANGDLDTIYDAEFYDADGDTPLFKLEINYAKISAEHLKNAHVDVYLPKEDGSWQDTSTVYTFPLSYSKGRFILTLDAMCDATLLRGAENDETAARSTLFSITRLTQGAKDIYVKMRARPNELYEDSLTESKQVTSNTENTLFVRGSNSDKATLKYFRHLYNLRWEEPTQPTTYTFSDKAANTTLDWTDGSVTVYCAAEDGGEPTPQVPSRTGDSVVAWPTIPALNKNVVLTGTTANTAAGRGHIIISNLQLRSTSVAKDAKKTLPAGTPSVMAVDHYVGLVGENNGTISKITLRDVDVQVNAEVKKAAEADTAAAMAMDANAAQYLQPMTDTAYRSEIWSVGALAGVDTGTLTDCTLDRSSRRGAEAKVTAVLHFSNNTTGTARADDTSIQDEPRGIGGLVGFAMPESGAKLSDLTIDQNVTVAGLLQDDDADKNTGTTGSTSTDAAEKARYKDIAEENADKTLWRSVGVGGLAGVLDATNLTGTGNLANITNKSTVVGNAFAGGIAGNLYTNADTAAGNPLSDLSNQGTVLAGANYQGGAADESAVLGQFFGGIAGYARDLTLENCTSATRSGLSETALTNLVRNGYDADGALNESSPLKGDFVGGLVGFGRDIQMTNCTTQTGYVLGRRFVGGFVGGFVGSDLRTNGGVNNSYVFGNRYVGGIVSVNGSNSQILNMTNKGLVAGLGKDAAYVGGIAGVNDASWGAQKTLTASDTAQLIDSTNSMSTVEVTDRNKIALLQQLSKTADGMAHYADFVGGVAGYNGTNGRIHWTAISASGAKLGAVLYGGSYVGGIAGYNDVSATISNAHTTTPSVSGQVVATGSCVGGVVGLNCSAKLPAVQVSANRIEGLYYVGGVVGANLPVDGFGFYDASDSAAAVSTIGTGRLLADGVAGGIIGYNRVISADELTQALAGDKAIAEELSSLLPGFGSGNAIVDTYTYTSKNNVTLTGLSNQFNIYANAYVGGIIGYNAQATTLTLVGAVNGNQNQAQSYGGLALGTPKDAANGDDYRLTAGVALGELDENYNGYFAGGIIGYAAQKTTLRDCRNYGGVQHPVAAGGLTGVNDGTITGGSMNNSMGNQQNGYRYLGGIAGINGATGTITNATLNENSSIRGGYDIGGIAGYNGGVIRLTSETKGNVYGITYTGGVAGYNLRTVTADTVNTKVSGTTATGGVAGYNDEQATIGDTSATAQILTVGSSTTVTSNSYGGGVAGVNLGTIANAVNTAKSVQVVNQYAGGIAGGNYGTIQSCTHSANGDRTALYTGGGYAGGIAGVNGGILPDNTKANNTKVVLNNVTVTGRVMAANGEAGGVTAHNYGTIDTATIQGAAVSGTSDAIGGAAACNEQGATVTGASLLAKISGTNTQGTTLSGPATRVGGLVGYNAGTLKNSSAEIGALDLSGLTASDNTVSAGGAVGETEGTETNGLVSNVTIALNLQDSMAKYQNLGGVAGINNGTLEKCTYTGAIGNSNGFTTVGSTVGGIVGSNESGHEVKNCTVGYIELKVQGASNVGASQDADTKLSSAAHIGGIAGRNRGTISGSTVGSAGHMGSIITARHGFVGGVAGSNSGTITTSGGEGTRELVTQIKSWLEEKYKDVTAEDGTVTKVLDSDAKNASLNQMVRVLTGKASGDDETAWQTKFNKLKGNDTIDSVGYAGVYTNRTANQLMVALQGGNTKNDFANGYVGGVTGFNDVSGQITDTASGQWFVYADNINQSWGAVGGIIGQNESDVTTTSGLVNFAAVRRFVRGDAAGADDNKNTGNDRYTAAPDNYVGGVIGTQQNRTSDRWTLKSCINIGTVFNSRSNNAGGVLAYWLSYGGTMDNCYNFGTITTNANNGQSSGTVGGVAGYFDAPIAGTAVNMYRCRNYGSVKMESTGANDVAGIFGKVQMRVYSDAMTINIKDCVNAAESLNAKNMAAGIFAYIGPYQSVPNVEVNIDRCRNFCYNLVGSSITTGIFGNRGKPDQGTTKLTTITNCFTLYADKSGSNKRAITYSGNNSTITGSNNYYMDATSFKRGNTKDHKIDGLLDGIGRDYAKVTEGWNKAYSSDDGERSESEISKVGAHRLYAGVDTGASTADGDNYYTYFAMLPKLKADGSSQTNLSAIKGTSTYITLLNRAIDDTNGFADRSVKRVIVAKDHDASKPITEDDFTKSGGGNGYVGQLLLLYNEADNTSGPTMDDITDEALQNYYNYLLDTDVPNAPTSVTTTRSGNGTTSYGRYEVSWTPDSKGAPAAYYHIKVYLSNAAGTEQGETLLETDVYDTKFSFEAKPEWLGKYYNVEVYGVNSRGPGNSKTLDDSCLPALFVNTLSTPELEVRLVRNSGDGKDAYAQQLVLKNAKAYENIKDWQVSVWLIDSGKTEDDSSTVKYTFNADSGNSFTVTWTDCDSLGAKTLRAYATSSDENWIRSERYNNQIYIPGVWNNSERSHKVNPGLANGTLTANAVLGGTNQDNMTITTTLSFTAQAAGNPVFRVMLLGKALNDTMITAADGSTANLKGQYITLAAQERTISATQETVTFADLPADTLTAYEDWRVVVVPVNSGIGDAVTRWEATEAEAAAAIRSAQNNQPVAWFQGMEIIRNEDGSYSYEHLTPLYFVNTDSSETPTPKWAAMANGDTKYGGTLPSGCGTRVYTRTNFITVAQAPQLTNVPKANADGTLPLYTMYELNESNELEYTFTWKQPGEDATGTGAGQTAYNLTLYGITETENENGETVTSEEVITLPDGADKRVVYDEASATYSYTLNIDKDLTNGSSSWRFDKVRLRVTRDTTETGGIGAADTATYRVLRRLQQVGEPESVIYVDTGNAEQVLYQIRWPAVSDERVDSYELYAQIPNDDGTTEVKQLFPATGDKKITTTQTTVDLEAYQGKTLVFYVVACPDENDTSVLRSPNGEPSAPQTIIARTKAPAISAVSFTWPDKNPDLADALPLMNIFCNNLTINMTVDNAGAASYFFTGYLFDSADDYNAACTAASAWMADSNRDNLDALNTALAQGTLMIPESDKTVGAEAQADGNTVSYTVTPNANAFTMQPTDANRYLLPALRAMVANSETESTSSSWYYYVPGEGADALRLPRIQLDKPEKDGISSLTTVESTVTGKLYAGGDEPWSTPEDDITITQFAVQWPAVNEYTTAEGTVYNFAGTYRFHVAPEANDNAMDEKDPNRNGYDIRFTVQTRDEVAEDGAVTTERGTILKVEKLFPDDNEETGWVDITDLARQTATDDNGNVTDTWYDLSIAEVDTPKLDENGNTITDDDGKVVTEKVWRSVPVTLTGHHEMGSDNPIYRIETVPTLRVAEMSDGSFGYLVTLADMSQRAEGDTDETTSPARYTQSVTVWAVGDNEKTVDSEQLEVALRTDGQSLAAGQPVVLAAEAPSPAAAQPIQTEPALPAGELPAIATPETAAPAA